MVFKTLLYVMVFKIHFVLTFSSPMDHIFDDLTLNNCDIEDLGMHDAHLEVVWGLYFVH